MVAAVLLDREVAAPLLGNGRGVRSQEARAAVEAALDSKISISKSDLAEAMARAAAQLAATATGRVGSFAFGSARHERSGTDGQRAVQQWVSL
jgi:hypothetical protein